MRTPEILYETKKQTPKPNLKESIVWKQEAQARQAKREQK